MTRSASAPASAYHGARDFADATGNERRWNGRLAISDLLLPLALLLWAVALRGTRPEAIDDYGLVPALPPAFFQALALLTVSFVVTLAQDRISSIRLGLHVVVLVLMLHGVAALVYVRPVGDYVYKHFGVVEYIARNSSLNDHVDIYQNWPAFFALAASFDSIAGVASPIDYAAWAPVYFNLLAVLAMALALKATSMSARLRWLAVFVFVATNWVGQDYFSPQALAFVLSLAVVACVIWWFRSDRPSTWVESLARCARAVLGASSDRMDAVPMMAALAGWKRASLLVAINAGFAAVVFSHQLSPFMVIAGVTVLGLTGAVRPRWLALGPIIITGLYLSTRLGYLTSHHELVFSFNPLGNARNQSVGVNQGASGRLLTAGAARALTLGMWALAAVGVVRRFRQGAHVLIPLVLMVVPASILFGINYGGEAIYRVYLFSLPWTAFFAAAAIAPVGRWTGGDGVRVMVILLVMLGLCLQSYFGLEQVNQVRPGEVAASQYFEERAPSGSVLVLAAPNFPQRITAAYDQFLVASGAFDGSVTNEPSFQHRVLTAADLPDIEALVVKYERRPRTGYLVITTAMKVYSHTFSVLPDGSLDSLDRALAASPNWRLFYRNQDAVIYQLVASSSRNGPNAGTAGR